jgi:hypothetical protein
VGIDRNVDRCSGKGWTLLKLADFTSDHIRENSRRWLHGTHPFTERTIALLSVGVFNVNAQERGHEGDYGYNWGVG